eukprot:gene13793-19702_t
MYLAANARLRARDALSWTSYPNIDVTYTWDVVESRYYTYVLMLTTIASCVCLAFSSAFSDASSGTAVDVLFYLEIVFVSTFCLELLLLLPFACIRASCVALVGVQVVLKAFAQVLMDMAGVLLVTGVLYIMFAVVATALWAGEMYYCQDSQDPGPMDSSYFLPIHQNINRSWCLEGDGVQEINSSSYHSSIGVSVPTWMVHTTWDVPKARFDSTWMSALTLFQLKCSSLECSNSNSNSFLNSCC